MSNKRPATQLDSTNDDGQAFSKSPVLEKGKSAPRRSISMIGMDPEMGEFEDDWEDEVDDEDGIVVDAKENEEEREEDAMEIDGDIHRAAEDDDPVEPLADVYLPGTHTLAKDEVLEADQSAYEMLHHMNVTWPCLSFDFLRDSLGDDRRRYPTTTYVVSGTQADFAKDNEVLVMKMSQLHRTQKDDGDSDSGDDESDSGSVDEDAILEYRSLPHVGGINRIRAQPLPSLPSVSLPYYAAAFSETSKVNIYDIRPLIESLSTPGYTWDKARSQKPVYTISTHRTEGFALDWSTPGVGGVTTPRLLSGDGDGKIYLTSQAANGHFSTQPQPFTSHTSSVEDIQWSPTEGTVFASCSADKSIRIWDVRVKGRKNAAGMLKAHDSDVNVISWNKGTSYLLISGGDEGDIKVWDLRNVKGTSAVTSAVALFNWHTAPITSIEWHPTEDSIFAASGADNQLTLWDLSVELDEDESGSKEIFTTSGEKLKDVPQQLLFVHQGQKDVKEVHWHPQIPGCVGSTASDGFNIFKTISV